jgi:hypothetical protein
MDESIETYYEYAHGLAEVNPRMARIYFDEMAKVMGMEVRPRSAAMVPAQP